MDASAPPAKTWRPPATPLRPAAPPIDVPAAEDDHDGPARPRRERSAASRRRAVSPAAPRRAGPPSTPVLAVCAWATGIGVLGLVVAARALVALATGVAPSWYEPTVAGVGTSAVAFTAAALATDRWVRLPWLMLGLATVPALVNIGLAFGLV